MLIAMLKRQQRQCQQIGSFMLQFSASLNKIMTSNTLIVACHRSPCQIPACFMYKQSIKKVKKPYKAMIKQQYRTQNACMLRSPRGVTAEYPATSKQYPRNSGYLATWIKERGTFMATWLRGSWIKERGIFMAT